MTSILTFGKRFIWTRPLCAVLVWALIVAPAQDFVRASEPAPATGGLSIASDPVGATIYVDGTRVGETPVALPALTAGSHRVRLVKAGYLENGRVITIGPGETKSLDVTLTRYSGTASASATTATSGGGSFLTSPLFLAAVGGGVVAAILLTRGNKPPVAGTVTPSATAGIVGIGTKFTAQGASDPGGKTLTYSWDFGDSSAASTDAAPTHAYTTTGTFTVTVKVSNGSKSATATLSYTVKTLTATWKGTLTGVAIQIVMTQSGNALSGPWTDGFGFIGTISGSVAVNAPSVTFTVNIPTVSPFVLAGAPSSDGNTMTGVANGAGLVNGAWTITRQ